MFAIVAIALATVVLDVAVLPVLLQESATDWLAYDQAARALSQHVSPYLWATTPDVRGAGQFPYLYPPPLALIWSAGFTAGSWAMLKLVAFAASTALAVAALTRTARLSSPPWLRTVTIGAGVCLALAQPPVIHDVLLGNVMLLYVAALLVLVAAQPGRWAAAPLGFVVAIAFKPLVAPVLVWMVIRQRAQLAGFVAAAAVTTALAALVVGPGLYLDYLAALPHLGTLAQPFSGNLGLSSISTGLALAAIPAALVWTALAASRTESTVGLAVAIALGLICQPVLGLNYGALLLPAVVLLWRAEPRAGLVAGIAMPLLTLVSPVLAGLVTAIGATLLGLRTPGARRSRAERAPANGLATANR